MNAWQFLALMAMLGYIAGQLTVIQELLHHTVVYVH